MIKRKLWPFSVDSKAGGDGELDPKSFDPKIEGSDSESEDELPQNLNRRHYQFSESETDESEEESSEGWCYKYRSVNLGSKYKNFPIF